jgi:peptidoglycan hydrolase CwlO-like protein
MLPPAWGRFSMPSRLRNTPLLAVLVSGALATGAGAVPAGQGDLAAQQAAADRLSASVAAESRQIAKTREGVAQAERELAALQAQADQRQAQLDQTQNHLIKLRIELTRLEEREAKAKNTLGKNLVASYKAGKPDFVSVILNSKGFPEMLERVEFYEKVAERNAVLLNNTRDSHAAVVDKSDEVEKLREHYSELAKAAIEDRDRAAVVQSALLQRQAEQLAHRKGMAQRLASVRGQITKIEHQQAAAAQSAVSASTATAQAPKIPAGAKGADAIVAKVVAAANQIASTPYVYGGGHGGASGGYDCSGSVSYALAGAGLVSTPLDSTGFESWGQAGEGQRITVYANSGHAFMVVDGRRFDTSGLSAAGTRWQPNNASTSGYVARHPAGL